jgi:tetratricopeptide (TPR) repeat protein
MSRSATDRTLLLALLALLAALPARAQEGATGFPLTAPVRRTLALMQQDWGEWLSAYDREDQAATDGALERLRAGLTELGMSRLPELAIGAAASAEAAARAGRIEWARQGLLAAEELDRGRPETAFAAARVERVARRPLVALGHQLQGYARAMSLPLERTLAFANLGLWASASLLVAGAAFVLVLMAVRGPRVVGVLLDWLGKQFSRPTRYVLAVLFLAWPILLPDGFFWLLLYWSALLWAQGGRAERVLLALLWVVMAATPGLVNELRRRVAVRLSPMVRAVEDAREGRLQGELFDDLARLGGVLPASPAVRQLLADQHRRLGQCELARPLYRQVLEVEPQNVAAHLDLGLCAFLRGELDEAIEGFRQAGALDPLAAAPYYNLSLAYSEFYRFEQSGAALARAQQLDPAQVAMWIHRPGAVHAAAADGGLGRGREIRGELLRSWVLEDEEAEQAGPWRDLLGVPAAIGCLLLALALRRLLPPPPRHSAPPARLARRGEIARRVLLPGLAEMWAGETLPAFLALLALAALVLVLRLSTLGFRLPWGFHPPGGLLVALASLGLAAFFLLRWRRAARSL